MNPVNIVTAPAGWTLIEWAKEQQDKYRVLPSIVNESDKKRPVVSVWEPDANELAALRQMIEVDSVQISLKQLTFGDPLQPVLLQVGNIVDAEGGEIGGMVQADADMLAALLQILMAHVSERGDSEGAVEVLERIIRERDAARGELESVGEA